MRVKRGNVARKRRKKLLKRTKGFRGSLSKLFRPAKQSYLKALSNSYKDRRLKKRDFRQLWIERISGALTQHDISYAKFMGLLKKQGIEVNRKMLADIALQHESVFKQLVETVTKKG